MSNGSEHMPEFPVEEKTKVFSYSTLDEKLFVYNFPETERDLQKIAEEFTTEIFFTLSDGEIADMADDVEVPENNLKSDFIYFKPGINQMHQMICTCNKFLEADNSMERLAKKAVKHARKTGHELNPRGN
jgi:hypothetical protein